MIVNRRSFHVKNGCMEQALALLRDAGQKYPHPQGRPRRLYTSDIGQLDVVAFEIEYADLAEYEAYWKAIAAQPWIDDFFAQWFTITEPGGKNEIWVVEPV
ncbi:MAG: NIPSNAP family protein [Caldilineaceae bacterium]